MRWSLNLNDNDYYIFRLDIKRNAKSYMFETFDHWTAYSITKFKKRQANEILYMLNSLLKAFNLVEKYKYGIELTND